ncbi:MAG TPA: pyridoxamine 5'-phosphate oxidase family protein [Gemmatimonadaceae bacterium]|nr:pyridoxamine 5'-phosphate oxidase family protein [Gemmatimonadaceae bacterium]
MMTKIEQPVSAHIRELGRTECDLILSRNHVGRVAFSFEDHVDIEPINYVYKDGWIYGRTSQGTKTKAIAHHMWVAFEVDEVVAPLEWRSVVVKGPFHVMEQVTSPLADPTDTSMREDAAFAQGVALLRSVAPDTLGSSDPTPFRHTIFRIHLDDVTGREAVPASKKTPTPQ